MNKSKRLNFSTKLCYGIGNLGYGSLSQTVNNFIMFFGTSIMGISGSLVGFVIALASLWDGVSDPLVGYISDRTKSKKFGPRLGFMLYASFALAIFNIMLWYFPEVESELIKCLYLLVMLIMIETSNTFFATPYSALAIDIAPDYNDQAKIQGYKTVFYIIGMILPSVLMFFFMPSLSIGVLTQFNKMGYVKISIVNSILCIVCGILCVFGCRKRAISMPNCYHQSSKHGLLTLLKGYYSTLKKQNFAVVMIGYSVALIAAAFLTSVGMHLFTFCYHFSSVQISTLMILLFGGAIISQILWVYVVKQVDKKQALIFSLSVILAGIALTLITFIFRTYIPSDTTFYLISPCIFICGVGTGALYSLPMSMYSDVITLDQYETGENNAGKYAGYFTFTYNLSNSLALLLIGVLLDVIKFDSTEPLQAMSVQNGLGLIVFLGCAVSLTISIIIFSHYKVKRADVLKVQIKMQNKCKDVSCCPKREKI